MRNATAPHCPEVAGALIDARGRRANAHRLPIRCRPQGASQPRMSKSDTKGVQCTGRMNENLGIMRMCSVRMRTTQAFVSDLDIHGSFRAPALVPSGPRWGRHWQSEARATRSVRRAGGLDRGPGPMVTLLRRSIRCACGHVPGLEPLVRRVMPGQPQIASVLRVLLCDRGQAGAGLIEPGLAALGQDLAALPQCQGVLQGD